MSKLKIIDDYDSRQWDEADWDEKLEVTINTLALKDCVNKELTMRIGDDYGEAKVELCCTEDNARDALVEGWLKITDGADLEINLWPGNGFPYYLNGESLWNDLYYLLEDL